MIAQTRFGPFAGSGAVRTRRARLTALVSVVACAAIVGCEPGALEPDESIGVARSSIVTANALALNGLGLNGVALNGVALNGLALNGVALNGVALNGVALNGVTLNGVALNGVALNGVALNGLALNGLALNGLALNGTEVDAFKTALEHIVACALPSGTCVTAYDTDSSPLVYCGDQGIDPDWETSAATLGLLGDMGVCVMNRATAAGDTVSHDPVLLDGFKQLMSYVASCALPAAASITITDENEQPLVYGGALGLAPEWETGPPTAVGARYVSACLLARVNAYGSSVPISVRSAGVLTTSGTEASDFPLYEATFYGDVVGSAFKAYSCLGTRAVVATTISDSRALRVCADSSIDCAIASQGRCADVCDTYTPRYGWRDCHAGGEVFAETVSVYLDRASAISYQDCPTGTGCNLQAPEDTDAVLDCDNSTDCSTNCRPGDVCTVSGSNSTGFYAVSKGMSQSQIDCIGSADCAARCQNNTVCLIDCTGADDCSQVECVNNAHCSLDCTGSANCGFATCHSGTPTLCPGDVVVCNRPCPVGWDMPGDDPNGGV